VTVYSLVVKMVEVIQGVSVVAGADSVDETGQEVV
jgi:hypothetical protein